MSSTCAVVNINIQNNGTWADAFQFGDADDTTWSFTGQNFIMEVKASRDDTTALLTMSSTDSTIIVDDVTKRVLHFNVPDTVIKEDLPVACYVYDLVMYDASTPPIRVPLMTGTVRVTQGVTGDT